MSESQIPDPPELQAYTLYENINYNLPVHQIRYLTSFNSLSSTLLWLKEYDAKICFFQVGVRCNRRHTVTCLANHKPTRPDFCSRLTRHKIRIRTDARWSKIINQWPSLQRILPLCTAVDRSILGHNAQNSGWSENLARGDSSSNQAQASSSSTRPPRGLSGVLGYQIIKRAN